MSPRTRISASIAVALLVAATAAIATGGAAGSDVATASARACDISGDQRELGASYVTSLKVEHATCTKARKVSKAFHGCRKDAGGANGKCDHAVLGFSCSEHRYDAVPGVQYNSRVKCVKGGTHIVKQTYTQNT
ncbi:MAG: hypothetical protein AABM29_08330 [Actinomycetota bacterium]